MKANMHIKQRYGFSGKEKQTVGAFILTPSLPNAARQDLQQFV
jgi:hypothetical protein